MKIVMNGEQELSAESADGLRVIPAFRVAVDLLTEKTALQTRLREVDKLLRKMDLGHPGICVVARRDLEFAVGAPINRLANSKLQAL